MAGSGSADQVRFGEAWLGEVRRGMADMVGLVGVSGFATAWLIWFGKVGSGEARRGVFWRGAAGRG